MPAKRLPRTVIDGIRADRAKGMTCREIARKRGVSVGAVSDHSHPQGIPPKDDRDTDELRREVHRRLADGQVMKRVAADLKIGHSTVKEWAKQIPPPEPEPEPDGPPLPQSRAAPYESLQLTEPGEWLVLSDLHLPHHDETAVRLAVAEAERRRAVGVLLNGDVLDSHELSVHDQDPRAARYVEEVEVGKQFFAWLRGRLPRARIVYKEGNHEERLQRYVVARAPALFGLEGVNVQSLLHLDDFGVEWADDRRVIQLGKLPVIHGHEYGRGAGGVNPARWLYLKARYVSLCGHFHRTSEHHARNIRGRAEAAWSVGCACELSPRWLRLNDWNHGFAVVRLDTDGSFVVENKRVLHGKVV